MGWIESLLGHVVGVDTAPFIYYTEENPNYIDTIAPFFEAVGRGDIAIITSVVTFLEVLVHPTRSGNEELANKYHALLFKTKGIQTIDVTQEVAEEAARLRASYNIRTPDAIHVATAIKAGADFILTNDIHFTSLTNPKILVLDQIRDNPSEATDES